MFEVGKKYRSKLTHAIFIPTFVGKIKTFGSYDDKVGEKYDEASFSNDTKNWEEYREPVVQTGIRYVIGKTDTESGFLTSEHSWHKGKIFGKYKITITDGELTDLEILDD